MPNKKQDFKHHTRYYVPHHFILYPLLFALLVASVNFIAKNPGDNLVWILFAIMILIAGWISYMMRQHYALTLQNRIVRLEMRVRYFELTGKRFDLIEQRLSFGQLAALRFASDEELPELVEKTIRENLPPGEIKKQITHWTPDHMRV